jgi:hypothetical protein
VTHAFYCEISSVLEIRFSEPNCSKGECKCIGLATFPGLPYLYLSFQINKDL